jgi:hypothetical protein
MTLKDPCKDEQLIASAAELVGILNRLRGQSKEAMVETSRYELFTTDSGCAKIELAYSSVASDFLSHHLNQLGCFHQMPVRKGVSDILVCHGGNIAGQYHPVCVIECGMTSKADGDMRKSLRGYANNYCPIVQLGQYFLGVEWLNVDSAVHARMRVKAFYRIPHDSRVHEVMLWNQEEGTQLEQMLARVMKAALLAAEHNFGDAQRKPSLWRRLSTNVAVDLSSRTVYKSFDYRDRWEDIAPGCRRDADASCRWISDCHIVAFQKDFTLLRYPLLNGVITAKKTSDFVSILKELANLHENDLVHGDIRAYNMLFVDGFGGKLIDFDYCGKHGVRCYPPGYWTSLPDTRRH